MKGIFGITNMQMPKMISEAIQGFGWDKRFSDKNADEKNSILIKAFLKKRLF